LEAFAAPTDAAVEQLNRAGASGAYWSQDLAPVAPSARKWGLLDMAALWVALSACIPTYMLASSLIEEGMNWWQALVTIFLANLIVLVPLVLNAHVGARYGVPFPVYCRAAFGLRGANIPAVLRALVACGWFGIQAWIGGWAIYKVLEVYIPAWQSLPRLPLLGISLPQLACFILFWGLNQAIVWRGIESVRLLLNLKAPLLLLLGLALLVWAYKAAGGLGPIFSQPSQFAAGGPKAGQFWAFFFPALTANVGFWATLALNIPDFTRYVRSQRDQVLGQALGLPVAMGLYAFIGVAVTSATVVIYGKAIWDPVVLLSQFSSPILHVTGLLALVLATLATNLAANVVSPANDFANLLPKRISFRAGAMITGIVGVLIQPWRLVQDPSGYIFRWLVAYSALLGAVGGVLIADYFVLRRRQLDLTGLYEPAGPYFYRRGFHVQALVALLVGIAPCVPGFLTIIGLIKAAPFWTSLYHYAWFISLGISFAVYLALTLPAARRESSNSAEHLGQTNYDEIASEYKKAKLHPWRAQIERHTLIRLMGDLRGKSLIDLGCGEGYYTREWRRRGASPVLGVDLSAGMIELARAEEERNPLGIEYRAGDARGLAVPRQYDVVFAAYLLNYARNKEDLITMCRAVSRCLKPGGLFLTVNNNPKDPPENFGPRDYGYSKRLVGELVEGAPVIWRFFLAEGDIEVENYYLSVETMEAAFDAAGLFHVRWHKPDVSLEGIREKGTAYWQDFLTRPPVAFISATR
jgi:NCS1 family nucleobase:cation symporter-1